MTAVRRRLLAATAAGALVVTGATFAMASHPPAESYAFVARGDDGADALAASSLAGRLNAPLVLTSTSTLPSAAAAALESADPDHVIIAGGQGAVSGDVEDAIVALLPDAEVRRVQGANRYETAQMLADLFPQIPPSFLAVDGKADAAEEADHAAMADDSAMFGGLAPDEYQFSWARREGSTLDITFPTGAETQVGVQIMPTLTIDVPVDGLLHVNILANPLGGLVDGFVALVDYEGDVAVSGGFDSALEIYDSMASLLAVAAGTSANVPLYVTPGEHTVRVFALNTPDGSTATIGLRSLTAEFSAGIDAEWEPFEPPPGPTPAGSTEGSMLLGRG